jgi:hypothetical protein
VLRVLSTHFQLVFCEVLTYRGPVVFVLAHGTQQACLYINTAHVKHSSVDANFENNVLPQD